MSIPLPDGVSAADFSALMQDKYDGSTENRAAVARDLRRLATGEPLAYVIGWVPFLGLRIYLDSKPLIPRPETEWWTEELASVISEALRRSGGDEQEEGFQQKTIPYSANRTREFRLLDLCAGSGAVGCTILKSFPNARVSFGELMPQHEATIRKNIEENGLDATRATIHTGDLFVPFPQERFDVIAVNPPYIPQERALEKSVVNFEPAEALFAGADGLDIIRRIASEAPAHLLPGGMLWLECDAEHAEKTRELVEAGAQKAEIRTDPYGRPRVIVGYY